MWHEDHSDDSDFSDSDSEVESGCDQCRRLVDLFERCPIPPLQTYHAMIERLATRLEESQNRIEQLQAQLQIQRPLPTQDALPNDKYAPAQMAVTAQRYRLLKHRCNGSPIGYTILRTYENGRTEITTRLAGSKPMKAEVWSLQELRLFLDGTLAEYGPVAVEAIKSQAPLTME